LLAALAALECAIRHIQNRTLNSEKYPFLPSLVGLNFLIAGALYSQGKLAFDPDLSVVDANFHSNTGLLAYVRSFDFAGQSAKFDVIVPASSFAARGLVDGQPREREMAGMGDPRFRVSSI
jgi:hypothetical protein